MIESRRAIKKLDQSVDDLEGSAVHPEVGELIICNSCSSSRQVVNLTSERIGRYMADGRAARIVAALQPGCEEMKRE